MNKIKLFIVLLFLTFGMQQTYSQTYKFKTSALVYWKKKNNKENGVNGLI
jgi:hypothetical protein